MQKIRKLATEKNIVLIFDECTTGFRETLNFKDISITNNALGKPSIKINNKLHNLINKKFKTKKINVLLSISDESKHSIAFVIIERT